MNNYMFWNSYGCSCKDELELWYYITLEQILTSMFDYNNLPKGLDRKYIEHCLIRFGCAGIVKVNDEYFVGIPAITPPLNNYGIGTKIVVTTFNGQHQITGTIGKDCVLIWNNSEFVNDYIISWFAKMFKEIDKSMESNVYNSRLHPIPIAKNSKIKSAIDNIFKTIKGENVKNETYSVLSEQAFEDVITGKSTPVDVINLTDVNNVDKIQYLSKFHDDLLRRFCTLYGHAMQTSGKMAQQTTEELQGYNSFSMIIPSNRMEERKKGIDDFNRIFNENVEITYSEAWDYGLYSKDNEEEVRDNDNGNI